MLEVVSFTGPAGVGKTHNLISEVRSLAESRDWKPWETILGLSYMHGARHRLLSRLVPLRKEGIPAKCETLDSFALGIARRFRRYLGLQDGQLVVATDKALTQWQRDGSRWLGSLSLARRDAVTLLARREVRAVVRAAHPIIVVDEFQDCAPMQISLVEELAGISSMYIAADEFQDLKPGRRKCPAVTWLRSNSEPGELTKIHRTDDGALLRTAKALRQNKRLSNCIEVIRVDGYGLAAWEIMKKLAWRGWRYRTTVLLSPTKREKSPFVRGTLSSLSKQLGKKRKLGPYPFDWITAESERLAAFIDQFDMPTSGKVTVDTLVAQATQQNPHAARVVRRVKRLCDVRGVEALDVEEIREIAENTYRAATAYGPQSGRTGGIAMTVHGAKNQEFENVAILWPAAIGTDLHYNRRLLYNAVTRATKRAFVVVQGGKFRSNEAVLELLGGGS